MDSEGIGRRVRGAGSGAALAVASVLMCALLCAVAGSASAKGHGCPKPKFLSGHRTALRITCASEGRGGSSVTVTAIWPRNAALFIYFTNKTCATTHRKAKALIRSEGNEGFVFDELLPPTGDRGWFTETSDVVFRDGPNQFKTTCAMVYATNGRGRIGRTLVRAKARLVA
jgi:hypothetical protein